MSRELSAVARTEFDNEVKHAFQGAGMLKGAVTLRTNVVGDTYKFRKMGKGLANQKSTADLVTPMNVEHEFATATLSNWNAPEYTDIFDAAEVNFSEQQELAQTIAQALGRRQDQLIIDALDGATPATTTVADGATGLTVAKLTDAAEQLIDQGVPMDGMCHFAISARGLRGLLNDEKATSADYNTVRALVSGDIDTFMGFKFHVIETRSEGGLSKSGNIRDCWAWHQSAVGLAIGMDLKTSVDWIAERTAWLSNGTMKAGTAVRDTAGIVKVQIDETA